LVVHEICEYVSMMIASICRLHVSTRRDQTSISILELYDLHVAWWFCLLGIDTSHNLYSL
jgi:hypothetical protein